MSKKIYSYRAKDPDASTHAPEEIHNLFVNELVSCVMGSEFIISIEFGLGGLLINLNINSVKTKYASPKNVVNALSKHFKYLSITSDSYQFEPRENIEFPENMKNRPSYYNNMIDVLKFSIIDLNNFENEVRDAIMSVDNFIDYAGSIIEKHLPHKKYDSLLRFSVVEGNLRLGYCDNLHDFPIERTIEKKIDSRINVSFIKNESNVMIPFGPYELLIDDIFKKRYLRDSEWPYLLFSDLEHTCREIRLIFDQNKRNFKRYKNFFSEHLKFFN